eukprot:sb/3465710/
MRPLTEEEAKSLFEKLAKYIGENVKLLLERSDGNYVFRYHKDKVYYVSEDIMKRATNIGRKELISLGTMFGKFSKTEKFKLHITSLDFISSYAKQKVWLKPGAEQQFLYGNNVTKAGLGRISAGTERYDGVVVYNMNDLPLGFGAAAKSTAECKTTDPNTIVVFHQADVGEYLRAESTMSNDNNRFTNFQLIRTQFRMRPLTEEEAKSLFEKLAKYIGENVKLLLERSDGNYVFRYHKDKVYYVSEDIMKRATNIGRKELISLGTMFGKFSKTEKFKLHITSLDFISSYAKQKVWLKPGAEQQFLYGNNVTKAGLGRISAGTERYDGVVVYNMNDLPLGFGAAAKSTAECKTTDPNTIVVFHQADVGEYLRAESTMS